MKRSKEKVTVKWSKKENCWITRYPEWENRNARILGNNFFTMIQEFEKYKSFDAFGKPTDFVSLRDMLDKTGFDPDTFTISVNAKVKKCDMCSKNFIGSTYDVTDENHNIQKELLQCKECFKKQVNE